MDSCLILKIVGISKYCGVSRAGKPYTLTTLEVDYQGDKARVKCFEENAKVGDYAQIGIGTKKSVYGVEFCIVVEKIVPAAEIEENFVR